MRTSVKGPPRRRTLLTSTATLKSGRPTELDLSPSSPPPPVLDYSSEPNYGKVDPLIRLRQMFRFFRVVDQPICAYLIPNNNEHMSEYLADCDKRLMFMSGFSGPTGTGVVTDTEALLWTDVRFFYQAKRELNPGWKLMRTGYPGVPNEAEWLVDNLSKGAKVGCNSKLLPYPIWVSLRDELAKNKIKLLNITTDLVNYIWVDRPLPPCNALSKMPEEMSGMPSVDKVLEVRLKMREIRADMLIVTALDDIAWLFNLRGNDIPYNPVFFAFAAITAKMTYLFLDEKKSHIKISNHLLKEGPVSIHPYEKFYTFVRKMLEAEKVGIKKVWIPSITNYSLYRSVPLDKRILKCSPIQILKATKNEVEAEGMNAASIKDGVALCQFFQWLENEVIHSAVTELHAAKQLEKFRCMEESYLGPSFESSSSSGPHTAIPHYTPNENSNLLLSVDNMYVCDVGAHYEQGTTDVTRTFHFGVPTDFQKLVYTRVFKGLAQLSTCVFPQKTKGDVLDSLARKFLWDVGLDYGHGTGHGIGCRLNVHEGPIGISWRSYPDDPGVDENMFYSIEPSFYSEGEFGVRIENAVQVISATTPYNFQEKTFLTFNTVTKCPIQTKMLISDLLTNDELQFLNAYHADVYASISPVLKKRGLLHAHEWLRRATAPMMEYKEY